VNLFEWKPDDGPRLYFEQHGAVFEAGERAFPVAAAF